MVVKLKSFMGVYLWGPFAEGYICMLVYISIFLWGREGGEEGGEEGDGTYSVFFFIFYYFKGSIYFHEVFERTLLLLL